MATSSAKYKSREANFFNMKRKFFVQLMAEVVATYIMIFAGCASVLTNLNYENVVGLVGISMTWGLVVMALVYTVGHVSGAHFNPSVTISFAIYKRFPWKQVHQPLPYLFHFVGEQTYQFLCLLGARNFIGTLTVFSKSFGDQPLAKTSSNNNNNNNKINKQGHSLTERTQN